MRDFSLASYLRIVSALRDRGLGVYPVRDWMRHKPASGVVMRHDVDRRPGNAVAMARAESAAGIKATYYFRVVGSANNPEAMKAVAELGHEVGYHYEDLSLAKGDVQKALKLFGQHLSEIRKNASVDTIMMHGSPLSRHYNLGMWAQASPIDFGLMGDAFLHLDYRDTVYLTETGRSWKSSSANLRDRPPDALEAQLDDGGTQAVLSFLTRSKAKRFAFSVHPERWDAGLVGWTMQYGKDALANGAKRLIRMLR